MASGSPLGQPVPGAQALVSKIHVGLDQFRAGKHDISGCEHGFEPVKARLAPARPPSTEAQLRLGHEGDVRFPTGDVVLVLLGEGGTRLDQPGAEDGGVDDDGTCRRNAGAHKLLMHSQNASASSSVRSSMTVSSSGGSGFPRARYSSRVRARGASGRLPAGWTVMDTSVRRRTPDPPVEIR